VDFVREPRALASPANMHFSVAVFLVVSVFIIFLLCLASFVERSADFSRKLNGASGLVQSLKERAGHIGREEGERVLRS
jgi:hypothetical protein